MSDHARLLRRPLAPKGFPPIAKRRPAPPRPSVGAAIQAPPLCLSNADTRGSSRQDVDHPVPRVAPPTPLPTDTPVPMVDKMIEGFPCKPPRTLPKIPLLQVLHTDPRFAPPPPSFCLSDFLQSRHGVPSPPGLRTAVLSRRNYKTLVGLLLMEVHRGQQAEVSRQVVTSEALPEVSSRTPHRQLVCELAALIHMEVQEARRRYLEGPTPGSEVDVWLPPGTQQLHDQDILCPGTEVILNSVTTKHFQGSQRTQSPFQVLGESISPSELAILDCLVQGGTVLSLKAHFIACLPDLSPLSQSLVYLNLSFNDLSVFPEEVYELPHLEVLKMRDNPMKELPAGIHRLVRLRTLVLSFCKISSLSADLYLLPSLQHLDVSYNLLSSLSNDIRKLRSLEFLNVEGNQLAALPCAALCLNLTQLKASRNYMHPYFLETFSRSSAQTLLDMAALALWLTEPRRRYSTLPPAAQSTLSRVSVCDCCRGPLFGPGLRVIRPCYHIFGRRRVPFVFRSCSPSCLGNFQDQTESLTAILYGDEAEPLASLPPQREDIHFKRT